MHTAKFPHSSSILVLSDSEVWQKLWRAHHLPSSTTTISVCAFCKPCRTCKVVLVRFGRLLCFPKFTKVKSTSRTISVNEPFALTVLYISFQTSVCTTNLIRECVLVTFWSLSKIKMLNFAWILLIFLSVLDKNRCADYW